MDKLTVKIKGAKELEDALKALGPRLASNAGDRALRAAAKPIIAEAKRLVPVLSGGLRRSITARTSSRGRKKDQRQVLIGFRPPTSRRAHLTEFGTVHSAAKPFMRPALDNQAGAALEAILKVLQDGIVKEALKLRNG